MRELARAGLKVGVVGYCWGGTMAWLAATRIDGLSATVGYYGGGMAETAAGVATVPGDAPLRGDGHSDPQGALGEGAAHPSGDPVHVYPAGHGFSCDARGSFHEPSAKQARERTMAFFRQHIG